MEVPKESATPWYMGEPERVIDHRDHATRVGSGVKLKYPNMPRKGWVCPDCYEHSVTFVPAHTRYGQPHLWVVILLALAAGLAVGVFVL